MTTSPPLSPSTSLPSREIASTCENFAALRVIRFGLRSIATA